ncbi:MAG: AAA family ATPase [Caldilineaceae bacterium]|nr:AAA family ATPase [Caldilineaceae bacterium]
MSDSEAILPFIRSTAKVFLHGPYGCGKTSLAVERIRWLLSQERIRGDDILVLVPQRTLAEPFRAALRAADVPPGPPVQITTFASLAQQAVERYWPLVSQQAGFADPAREPTFLTLETAQYHMAPLVDEAIDRGEFDGVRVERSRVISQVLDNLNKAALQTMDIDTAYRRLELAVPAGEQQTARLNALRAALRVSHAFRTLCLRDTLLDYSLQVVLFNDFVLQNEWSRTHLFRTYRHLVCDNVEEDTHSAHRLVQAWLPTLDSALLVADDDAGYRTFLGAEPAGVQRLAEQCEKRLQLRQSYVMSMPLQRLGQQVQRILRAAGDSLEPITGTNAETPAAAMAHPALVVPEESFRFYPQMLEWTADQIHRLVAEEGVAPGDIAVLAPFVSDALRFSLERALERHAIALTTHRPSRALEAEPAARTLFTLAKLAHPHWGLRPAPADVTLTLNVAIAQLDPVRASLLSTIVYPPARRDIDLGRFGVLQEEMRQRVTYVAGEQYERLHSWLYAYRAAGEPVPLDQFFAHIFGEVLSQPGFGFHAATDAARVASQLVESARKFRWALEGTRKDGPLDLTDLGRAYLQLAEAGAIGALYLAGWRSEEHAVFLAPAYTFLLRNRPVSFQFWLDIGSNGWWERLYQPLTHPYVLSQRWPENTPWTDHDEYTTRQQTMRCLLLGLIRRTRRQIYLGVADYSESGFEQRGPLLNVVNQLLVQMTRSG